MMMNVTLREGYADTFTVKANFDFPRDFPVNIPVIISLCPGPYDEIYR
jgi:hypothetical protein